MAATYFIVPLWASGFVGQASSLSGLSGKKRPDRQEACPTRFCGNLKMNARKYIAPDGALFLVLMRLQLWRTYGAKGEVMKMFFRLIKIVLPLAIVAFCLFGFVLHSQSGIFGGFQTALLSADWMLLACIAVWCGTFLFLTFSRADLPLIGLLLIAIAAFFIGYAASWQSDGCDHSFGGRGAGQGKTAGCCEEYLISGEMASAYCLNNISK